MAQLLAHASVCMQHTQKDLRYGSGLKERTHRVAPRCNLGCRRGRVTPSCSSHASHPGGHGGLGRSKELQVTVGVSHLQCESWYTPST